MQRGGAAEDIFRGVAALNKYLQLYNRKTRIQFFSVISEKNIRKIPDLIKKAAELRVSDVNLYMCRYYAHKVGGVLKAEDSLFYHQALYNGIIKEAEESARSLNVRFSHPPLFGEPFKEDMCTMGCVFCLLMRTEPYIPAAEEK